MSPSTHVKEDLLATKYEYQIIDEKEVLKNVTRERRKTDWYNSAIFLWVMGALFFTILPLIWKKYESNKELSEKIQNIDYEISGRFQQLFDIVARMSDSVNQNTPGAIFADAKNVFYGFKIPPRETSGQLQFFATFKDFDEYPVTTLINLLASLVGRDKKKELQAIVTKIHNPAFIPVTTVTDPQKFLSDIKRELYLKRWQ